jgi:hypothetical protein
LIRNHEAQKNAQVGSIFANLSCSGEQISIFARHFLQVIPVCIQYDGLFEVNTATLERPAYLLASTAIRERLTVLQLRLA